MFFFFLLGWGPQRFIKSRSSAGLDWYKGQVLVVGVFLFAWVSCQRDFERAKLVLQNRVDRDVA